MFPIQSNNKIPEGFPLMVYSGCDYYEPIEQLKTVFNLRHSLFDKLEAIPKLTHALHKNIKNIFSSDDIYILSKMLLDDRINSSGKSFISNIINNNLVVHTDTPKKNCDHILSFKDFRGKFPQKTYKTFSKWFGFSNETNAEGIKYNTLKVNTIIKDEIYLAKPTEFNDIFDCQLHLNDIELLKFANNLESNMPMARQVEILAKYCANICSFSLNVPHKTDSNHMWGYYGSSGRGFVITYNLDHLISLAVQNLVPHNSTDSFIFFEPTIYKDTYNPGLSFSKCINEYFGKNNKSELINFIKEFTNTKTNQWQFENEFRIHKLTLSNFQNLIGNNNWNSLESCQKSEEFLKNNTSSLQIKFMLPIKITFGWSCDKNDEDIIRVIEYANKRQIEMVQLEKYINYETSEFYQKDI